MSHERQVRFLESVLAQNPRFRSPDRLVEFGSRYVNGDVRGFFKANTYIGVDAVPGDGVDVESLCHLYQTRDTFDVVLSFEMLEHDPYFPLSLLHMVNLLRPGGLFVMTCACTNRAEHGTERTGGDTYGPDSRYYKNLSPAEVIPYIADFRPLSVSVTDDGEDLQVWGIK